MPVLKSQKSILRKNSTGSEFKRRRINLIEGSNVTLTVADDSANNETDVTIAAASSSPGGSNTQIQFNDSGSFGGDADFTWDKTSNVLGIAGDINFGADNVPTSRTIKVTNQTNSNIAGNGFIFEGANGNGIGDGGYLSFDAGQGGAGGGIGGQIFFNAGDAASGSASFGGDITFNSGAGDDTGTAGAINIQGGNGGLNGAAGGAINITSGDGGDSQLGVGSGDGGTTSIFAGIGYGSGFTGGQVYIASGGGSDNGNGGDIFIDVQAGNGAGTNGRLTIRTPGSSQKGILNFDSLSSSDKTFTFPNASGTIALTSTTLTSGSVVFAGSSGILTEDNSNFFWDDTGKRLGLGTTTPGVLNGTSFGSVRLHMVKPTTSAFFVAETNQTNANAGMIFNYTPADANTRMWSVAIQPDGTASRLAFSMVVDDGSPTAIWYISKDGHLLGATDNSYDIGASGATRPRNIYIAGTGAFGGNVTFSARVLGKQGADVASANNLVLGSDGNAFEITGTTQINLISNLSWQNGSQVTLLFTSNPTVKHNQTTSTTNITIQLAGATDFVASAGDTLTLLLSEIGGTQAWREISRAVI